jgi:hypothetical protein
MEDDLKIIGKWKTTSTFLVNGRRLTFFANGRQPTQTQIMEDTLNFGGYWTMTSILVNGRRPYFFYMEDALSYSLNER